MVHQVKTACQRHLWAPRDHPAHLDPYRQAATLADIVLDEKENRVHPAHRRAHQAPTVPVAVQAEMEVPESLVRVARLDPREYPVLLALVKEVQKALLALMHGT